MPDGRVVLYDAGAMRGPDVTRAVIAPYLRARRVYRVDDVVLSHADLDHYNALIDLADRFRVGRVLCGETFAERPAPGVQETMRALDRRRVRVETVAAGDRLLAGEVTLDVLHPPRGFRAEAENARSVVLHVRHGEGSLLLTGDLEKEGLAELLRRPKMRVDVLQAPHHGSARLDVAGLLRWCEPKLVVSSQGPPRSPEARRAYEGAAPFWTTHDHGAITVRSRAGALEVEAYRTGKRLGLR
jgi:competence protein ComEC